MKRAGSQDIRTYFDSVATDRDGLLDGQPILQFEQERRQAVVLRLLQPAAGERVLDVGCGNGRDVRALASMGVSVVGVDFSFAMLADAGRELERRHLRARRAQADAVKLPFLDGSFDKVVCSEVVEHVPDAGALVTELARVLAPGGRLVLTTPNRLSLYGAYRNVERVWGAVTRFRRRLRGASGQPAVRVAEHPFDEWKTNAEVARLLSGAGLHPVARIHSCYVPSHLTYKLPRGGQQAVVRVIRPFERALEGRLSVFGYTIAVAAQKRANAN